MDPTAHQYLRFSLELLSYLSNIVLAGLAIAALYQIILAKRSLDIARSDIELRSKREAVTLAANRSLNLLGILSPNVMLSLDLFWAPGFP